MGSTIFDLCRTKTKLLLLDLIVSYYSFLHTLFLQVDCQFFYCHPVLLRRTIAIYFFFDLSTNVSQFMIRAGRLRNNFWSTCIYAGRSSINFQKTWQIHTNNNDNDLITSNMPLEITDRHQKHNTTAQQRITTNTHKRLTWTHTLGSRNDEQPERAHNKRRRLSAPLLGCRSESKSDKN